MAGANGVPADGGDPREKTPEEKLTYLSMKLADRLREVEGGQDLLYYFMDEERWVSVGVLLMDKSLRRTAFRDAPPSRTSGASHGQSAYEYMLQAAEVHEDLSIKRSGNQCLVRANQKQLPKAVEEVMRRVDNEMAVETQALAAAPTPTVDGALREKIPMTVPTETTQRNWKGELAQVVCKRLGRSASKEELRYEAWKVSEKERLPSYKAQCTLWGETYESRAAHGNKKAAEQDAALVALEALQNEPDETKDGNCSVTTSLQEIVTDYKGQLLQLFQTLGKRHEVRFDVFRVNEDSEEKFFQAKVYLPGQEDAISGHPMSRNDFESSEKTRRAAQQDAARVALQVLSGATSAGASLQAEPPTKDLFAPPQRAEVKEVEILWLPLDAAQMVHLRRVQVLKDDFLGAVEAQLGGLALCHPLTWMGNRPKGLCLYEAIHPETPRNINSRASALVGLDIHGESFLMDASAHSKGAALVDMTLPRYEQLKADRTGFLANPAVALNQHRGMLICGHPKLPEKFSAETWIGVNPKSLLIQVASRRGFNAPQVEVFPYQSDDYPVEEGRTWFRASASITKEDNEVWDYGEPSTNKMDTQQDAALKVLQQLQKDDGACRWNHPLLETLLQCARDAGGFPVTPFIRGSKVTLSYQIKLFKEGVTGEAIEMVLERQERITVAASGRVLHPNFQELLQTLTVGGEGMSFRKACHYEGIACEFLLDLQLLDLQLPVEPEPPKKVIKFTPPLWKQRQHFIVEALLCRSVKSVLDMGCGDGQLLEALLPLNFDRLYGLELSEARVKTAQKRLGTGATVLCGDLVRGEEATWTSFTGVEAIVLCEVLEHLPEASMPRLPQALFSLQPQVVVVTSPNADFGASDSDEEELPETTNGSLRPFRHADHEREWTRAEFRDWSERVASDHGYWISELGGVGYLPDQDEANGPCTQLCIFERKDEEVPEPSTSDSVVFAEEVDTNHIVATALRCEELGGEGSGLWKYVQKEGTGTLPPAKARVNLHYASYSSGERLASVVKVESSREKNRSTPCAFQLGGQQALLSWQLAAASMRPGEIAWICSPPKFAYGEQGVPPSVPPNATMWFALELNFAKAPGTVKFSQHLEDAMVEAEKHMEVGRADLQRKAFAQGRQAFRRALAAVPEKLLLKQRQEELARFATLERASLLNQALCCLKLGDSLDPKEGLQHFRAAIVAMDTLLQRHGVDNSETETTGSSPETIPELQAMLRQVSLSNPTWQAKAYFRRGSARERLQYLADAIEDYEAALTLEPDDTTIAKQLQMLQKRQRKTELKPEKMFAGILQRERAEREKEEAAADLAARKLRREERLKAEAEQAEMQQAAAVT